MSKKQPSRMNACSIIVNVLGVGLTKREWMVNFLSFLFSISPACFIHNSQLQGFFLMLYLGSAWECDVAVSNQISEDEFLRVWNMVSVPRRRSGVPKLC